MAVSFLEYSAPISSTQYGATWSHTVSAGDDKVLIVWVGTYCRSSRFTDLPYGADVTVTYGGAAMTQLIELDTSSEYYLHTISAFYLLNPPEGAANVVVTVVPTDRYKNVACIAETFAGVLLSSPFLYYETRRCPETTYNKVFSCPGSLVVDCVSTAAGRAATPGPDQSAIGSNNSGSGGIFIKSTYKEVASDYISTTGYTLDDYTYCSYGQIVLRPTDVSIQLRKTACTLVTSTRSVAGEPVNAVSIGTSAGSQMLGFRAFYTHGLLINFTHVNVPKDCFIRAAMITGMQGRYYAGTGDIKIDIDTSINPVCPNDLVEFNAIIWAGIAVASNWYSSDTLPVFRQGTDDLKDLLQYAVNRSNWNANNAMMFYLSGIDATSFATMRLPGAQLNWQELDNVPDPNVYLEVLYQEVVDGFITEDIKCDDVPDSLTDDLQIGIGVDFDLRDTNGVIDEGIGVDYEISTAGSIVEAVLPTEEITLADTVSYGAAFHGDISENLSVDDAAVQQRAVSGDIVARIYIADVPAHWINPHLTSALSFTFAMAGVASTGALAAVSISKFEVTGTTGANGACVIKGIVAEGELNLAPSGNADLKFSYAVAGIGVPGIVGNSALIITPFDIVATGFVVPGYIAATMEINKFDISAEMTETGELGLVELRYTRWQN